MILDIETLAAQAGIMAVGPNEAPAAYTCTPEGLAKFASLVKAAAAAELTAGAHALYADMVVEVRDMNPKVVTLYFWQVDLDGTRNPETGEYPVIREIANSQATVTAKFPIVYDPEPVAA